MLWAGNLLGKGIGQTEAWYHAAVQYAEGQVQRLESY